jgi:ribosomal-protein-alanine N-acetyltransferase
MNNLNFIELTTERLVLRKLIPEDAPQILFLRSDEDVNKFIKRKPMSSLELAKQFIEDRNKDISQKIIYYWGITLKNNPQLIGTICFWNLSDNKTYAEIGYDLMPEFQHKGIMNEAFKEVILFGIETLKLHKIEAYTQYKNESSIKLLLKNKFILQKDKREEGFPDNRIYLLEIFSSEVK